MPDHTPIPASAACGRWEALLADSLDGLLAPSEELFFAAHRAECPECAKLYEEARRGWQWLEFLAPEPEVPTHLLDQILAHTGPDHEDEPLAAGHEAAALPPVWQQAGFAMRMRRLADPRLMMTVAMAFFSICLTMNLTGVRVNEMRWSSLRPENLRGLLERRLTMASTPIVRYYDHIRLVYEMETRLHELRRGPQGEGVSGEEGSPANKSPKPKQPGDAPRKPLNKEGSDKNDPSRQAATPIPSEILETALTVQKGPAFSSGSADVQRERSTPWIA